MIIFIDTTACQRLGLAPPVAAPRSFKVSVEEFVQCVPMSLLESLCFQTVYCNSLRLDELPKPGWYEVQRHELTPPFATNHDIAIDLRDGDNLDTSTDASSVVDAWLEARINMRAGVSTARSIWESCLSRTATPDCSTMDSRDARGDTSTVEDDVIDNCILQNTQTTASSPVEVPAATGMVTQPTRLDSTGSQHVALSTSVD